MVKIQVLGKGYHPLIGFLPKWTPFYADQNTIGWLLAAGTFKIRYFNPDTNRMEDIDRKNYIPVCNNIFSKPIPPVIPKEIYENLNSDPPSVEPPSEDPGSGGTPSNPPSGGETPTPPGGNTPNPGQPPNPPKPPKEEPSEPEEPAIDPSEEATLEAISDPPFIHERQDKDFRFCNDSETYAMMNPDVEDGKIVLYKNTLTEIYARIIHQDGILAFDKYAPTNDFKYETYNDESIKRTRTKPTGRVERTNVKLQTTKIATYKGEDVDYVENATCGIISSMRKWSNADVLPYEQKYFNYKNCPYGVAITELNGLKKDLSSPETEEHHKNELEGSIRYGSISFYGFPTELSDDFSKESEKQFKVSYVGVKGGMTTQQTVAVPFILKDRTFLSWYDIGILKEQKKATSAEKAKILEYSKDFTQVNIIHEPGYRFAIGQHVQYNPRLFAAPEGVPFNISKTTGLLRTTFFVRKPYEPKIHLVDYDMMDVLYQYTGYEMIDMYVTVHYLDEKHTKLEQRSLMNRFVYDIDDYAVSNYLSDRGESKKSAGIMGEYWNDITTGCTSDIWFVALSGRTLDKDPDLSKALWANYKLWFDVNKAPH